MDMSLSNLPEQVMDREAWRAAVHWGRKEWDMSEWLNWNLAECLAYVYDVLNKFLLKNWANDIRVKVSLFLSHHLTTGFYKLEINIYTPNLSLHGRPSRHTNMHETQSVSWTYNLDRETRNNYLR